jgi:hypothetical protein
MLRSLSWQRSITATSLLAAGILGSLLMAKEAVKEVSAVQPDLTVSQTLSQTFSPMIEANSPASGLTHPQVRTAVALALAVGGGAVIAISAQRHISGSTTPQVRNQTSFDRVSSRLRHRLLRLLHNDRRAASRLFTQATLKYPNQSADWCVEKVIYDLERDRH